MSKKINRFSKELFIRCKRFEKDEIFLNKKILHMTFMDIIKRGDYFYHFFYWLYGLYYDIVFCGKPLNKTVSTEYKGAYPAQCINYQYMCEFIKKVQFDEKDVFVDVGCAWGRIINYLDKKTCIEMFIGIELDVEIGSFAKNAFKNRRNIKIIIGDVLENIPITGTVFYLFNPFDKDILSEFLKQIESKITHPIKLLYLYPQHSEVFNNNPKWSLNRRILLKPKFMGGIELYEYLYDTEINNSITNL